MKMCYVHTIEFCSAKKKQNFLRKSVNFLSKVTQKAKYCMFSLKWILVFNIHIYVNMGAHISTDHKIRKTTRGRKEVLRRGGKGNRTMWLKL